MKGDDIAERLLVFACDAVEVAAGLPSSVVGRHACAQLTRAGTSGGANYEEARGAESAADFAHKLGIAAKEVRETVYWLRVIARAKLSSDPRLGDLVAEGRELFAILMSSARTVRSRN